MVLSQEADPPCRPIRSVWPGSTGNGNPVSDFAPRGRFRASLQSAEVRRPGQAKLITKNIPLGTERVMATISKQDFILFQN
jgi:hypothetical protein